jgi:hypothetical protein
MRTLTAILDRAGVTVPDELLADLEVPVISDRPQRQGDVYISPVPSNGDIPAGDLIPRDGVAVVRGEATGNTHLLMSTGPCTWAPATTSGGVLLGHLHVPEGEVCDLIHTDEHGVNSMGAGTYRLTGKREMADEIRRVAD